MAKERQEWESGTALDGKEYTLIMDLDLVHEQPRHRKDGKGMTKEFFGYANIGDMYEGVEVGEDEDGNKIMAKVSIYQYVPPVNPRTSKATSGFRQG